LSGWQELPHPWAERGASPSLRHVVPLIAQWSRGCTLVNDALGSFLLRANEVIDQVPMSLDGTSHHSRALPNLVVNGA